MPAKENTPILRLMLINWLVNIVVDSQFSIDPTGEESTLNTELITTWLGTLKCNNKDLFIHSFVYLTSKSAIHIMYIIRLDGVHSTHTVHQEKNPLNMKEGKPGQFQPSQRWSPQHSWCITRPQHVSGSNLSSTGLSQILHIGTGPVGDLGRLGSGQTSLQ